MTTTHSAAQRLVVDPAIGGDLRASLARDPQTGIKQTAKQFEALLLNMMLKSMRDASPSNGLLDNEQSQFFNAMGDQQLAQTLAAQSPLGLAAMIERQLDRQGASNPASPTSSPAAAAVPATPATPTVSSVPLRPGKAPWRLPVPENTAVRGEVTTASGGSASNGLPSNGSNGPASKARSFVDRVWPHALEAAAAIGVPAHFLVAQSALESAWGKSEIRGADGTPSFNLFGIKAGRNWSGATVEVPTTEYINGVAKSVRAKFRAYASYADAFRDYASLLASKPRFAAVLGQQDGTQFARSLQQAGYATDPMYADKLTRIIDGPLLRQALTG
ncbi:MAG TPA: flagellar assembly peptidoglycan hydrolase FlgJ [Accumulibacter sp.]|nr:flagellar assembly peptidoglycan hydrolase FlgJ [Accumulibacter sp.]HMW16468.1 flagellar assembly peptidoglycan hydrolase FlgJ [Accumulibacter sp.]HMX22623.1 flagellar assembly peptidoglycan hydrolase FlgJ [Accumulibacter sp.]HMY07859.1 flagellar assembly peptidoglycan hydrolase FlgJ [Accumulibacter sp.]HNC16863.1 flagellar assembly peptidoglycan hydrolase FlgJ [Accumulibacter sp.]